MYQNICFLVQSPSQIKKRGRKKGSKEGRRKRRQEGKRKKTKEGKKRRKKNGRKQGREEGKKGGREIISVQSVCGWGMVVTTDYFLESAVQWTAVFRCHFCSCPFSSSKILLTTLIDLT